MTEETDTHLRRNHLNLFKKVKSVIFNPVHQWVLLGTIVLILAALLRLYKFTEIPAGLTWDEAAIGYNGWSVWQTKRDEWLQLAPISFRSFGDYKAPLAVYVVGIFTHIFGLNAFAVRLPFVLSGILACIAMGWLTIEWRLGQNQLRIHKKQNAEFSIKQYAGYVVLSISLLAFSPWHLHFSRAGFESGIALLFVIIGLATWYRALRVSGLFWFFGSILFFCASLYTYHSAKIVVPLLGLVLLFQAARFFRKKLHWVLFGIVFTLLLLVPLLFDSIYRGGATRFTQTSIISSTDLSTSVKIVTIIKNYISHFSPEFLVLGNVTNFRQGMGEWGILLPVPFLLIVAWVVVVGQRWLRSSGVQIDQIHSHLSTSIKSIPLFMILIGLLPSALGIDEVPHTIRSLLALPGFILLSIAIIEEGVEKIKHSKINLTITGSHDEKNILLKAILGTLLLIHLITVVAMISAYFTKYQAKSSSVFTASYVPAMKLAHAYALGDGVPKKDKIIVSSKYGQPYIFSLFANKISPYSYHNGIFINYEYKELDMGDFQRPNTVIFATQQDEDFLAARADQVFYGPDGSVQFKVFLTQ